jgi:hypothetical protein
MSTIVMAACWPLQMPATAKSVLISLADQASDDGVCWPSVGTIAKRTCLSERAVQEAIAWLQTVGVVFREYRINTSTSYTITPGKFNPKAAPAKRKRGTGAPSAPGADGAPPAGGAPGADGAPPPADGAPGGEHGAPPPPQEAHPRGAHGAPKSSLNRNRNRNRTANEPSPPAAQPGPEGDGVATGNEETALQSACKHTWAAYGLAYEQRYGVKPVRNQVVNANVKTLVKRLGYEEAPLVAAWYVESVNESFVVKNTHGVGILTNQAESFRTQWARGQAVTNTRAQQTDKNAANASVVEEAQALLRAQRQDAQEGGAC